jgi:hypothetical protein
LVDECKRRGCALLTLPPGAGKTAIALTVVKEMGWRAIVVAPPRVAQNTWKAQAAIWAPELRVSEYLRDPARRQYNLSTTHDLLVTHYELLPQLSDETQFFLNRYDCLIVDESGFARNPNTRRFKELKRYAMYIPNRIAMNGTPLETRGPMDLWAQAYLVDRGKALGRFHVSFQNKYAWQDCHGNWNLKAGIDPKEIISQVEHLVLGITEEEYPELPDLVEELIEIKPHTPTLSWMSDQAKRLAEAAAANPAMERASVQKMQQVASGFIYHGDSEVEFRDEFKIRAALDIVDSLRGQPFIIVYEHKAVERAVAAECQKRGYDYAEFRDAPLDEICRKQVVCIHPASAGHGVDGLQTRFRHMIVIQPDWSGSRVEQTIKRLHRPGVKEPVVVYWLISKHTIEETVFAKARKGREHLKLEDYQ